MGSIYERVRELKAFDDSKAGVKGLVDAGVTNIPRIFIHEKQNLDVKTCSSHANIKIPIIDLQGVKNDERSRVEIIEKVKNACEKFGFFQVVNHGIPVTILDKVIDGIRKFHEQDVDIKKEYYSREYSTKKVLYNSNFNLFEAPAACWRDTLTLVMGQDFPNPDELPAACRDIMMSYKNEVLKLGFTLYQLISEALGLDPNYLNDMGCAEAMFVPCHYYPACPEPESTMGATTHADSGFLSVLLQDQIGGLQVLYENQWIHVAPTPGALVLITNDKFVSAYHRVVARNEGPRISVASIFRTSSYPENNSRLYGPIKELLSEENPPIYRQITITEMIAQKHSKSTPGVSALAPFKL
ncbi:hypothetical protein Patl1_25160 [Pistacia atlantica]|uniref:Uncharacterized protein n=1 Tax=Pistacia atlantica TaxID=434234 RepID=A0ACC1B2J2_9ROSI|nr:hypothetical protein Patl1_25160 [Pistacia atlantica]